jgi:hypothetical protein
MNVINTATFVSFELIGSVLWMKPCDMDVGSSGPPPEQHYTNENYIA